MQRLYQLSKNSHLITSYQSSLKLAVKVPIKSLSNIPCSNLMHVLKSLVNLQEEYFSNYSGSKSGVDGEGQLFHT